MAETRARWQRTPDAAGPDDAWDLFAASLVPDDVEQERYRAPGPGERPWSREDLELRHAHQWVTADFWQRAAQVTETRRRREDDLEHEQALFIAAVAAARRDGTPYPTAPIAATLDAHRAELQAGGRAA